LKESHAMQLKDKVAVVTGAASGIGKEIAMEYAKEGAKVCIADLNLEAATVTAEEINKAGFTAMAVAMNVTDEAQVDAAVARVVAKFGGVDVLIVTRVFKSLVHWSISSSKIGNA
jgi:3-hydroxybutyrate dehydrogenase